MKKTRMNLKSIIKYFSTIISWSIFVILLACAVFLVYYYISMQVYARKGSDYAPPYSIYTIVSPSMTPNINVYDIIINTKVDSPNDIQVGDVITFKSTSSFTYGMTITHRVVEIQNINGEYEYITQGDNNVTPDTKPAKYYNIIGKAVVKLPQFGRIQFFVASRFGWLVVVVLPALYIIVKDIMKLIKITKIKKDAQAANKTLVASVENNTSVNNTYKQE